MLSFLRFLISKGNFFFNKEINTFKYREQFTSLQARQDFLTFCNNFKLYNYDDLIKKYKFLENNAIQRRARFYKSEYRTYFEQYTHPIKTLTSRMWRWRKVFKKRGFKYWARWWCIYSKRKKSDVNLIFKHGGAQVNYYKLYNSVLTVRQYNKIFFNYRILLHRAAVCANQVKHNYFRDLIQLSQENLLLFQYQSLVWKKKKEELMNL